MTMSTRRAWTFGLVMLSAICPLRAEPNQNKAPQRPYEQRQVVEVITTDEQSTEPALAGDEGNRRSVTIWKFDDESGPLKVSPFSRKRGYLGAQLIELTPELRRHFGAPTGAGAMISRIEEDSPAELAGLEVGDTLIAIDGQEVTSAMTVLRLISELEDQSQVELRVVRGSATLRLPVTIVERERPSIDLGRLALAPPGEHFEYRWGGADKIGKHVIRIDPKGLEDAMHELEARLDRPEFVGKFQDLGQSRLELQQRISDLEERLKSLEQQLAEFAKH